MNRFESLNKPFGSVDAPELTPKESKILNIWSKLPGPIKAALVGIPLGTAILACGRGSEARASNPVNTTVAVDNPTAVPTVGGKPTEVPKQVVIPEQAQVFLKDLDSINSINPETKDAIKKGFVERDWPKAVAENTAFRKFDAYYSVYGSLSIVYNVSHDPATKAEMDKIRDYLASVQDPEWASLYKQLNASGAFLK